MPRIWIISIVLQVICAVHAVKTGRRLTWVFIICVFPLIGCTVYFITEMIPDFMENPRIRR